MKNNLKIYENNDKINKNYIEHLVKNLLNLTS